MTKDKMIKYITSFAKYPTMNSWNGSYGYSINAKIHNLPLRSGEKDKLYEIIGDESLSSELWNCLEADIANWRWENKDLLGVFTEKKYYEGKGWYYYDHAGDRAMAKDVLKRKLAPESREKFEGFLKNKQSIYGAFYEYREQVIFDAGFNGRSGGHLVLYKWNGHNFAGTGWTHDAEELQAMNKEDVRYIYQVLRSFEKLFEAMLETARAFASEEITEEEYTVTKTRKVFKNAL